MEIKGFIPVSLSDWDGKVSSVLFTPNCNLRCPFCYNKGLVLEPKKMPTIPLEHVEHYLETNRKWIDGVVITGGEPTLHADLASLCEKIKKKGFGVKVDTNGTHPDIISKLVENELVNYVALDVKAPLTNEKYSQICGTTADRLSEKIRETIKILLTGDVDYEFRTTLVPTLHRVKDVEGICTAIEGCRKYALQNFKSEVDTIDPKFQSLKPFSTRQMESFLKTAKRIVPNTVLRH